MKTLASYRVLFVVALVIGAAALTGCVKFKQNTAVMPDGSGKMTFRIGFNESAIKDSLGGMMGGGESGGDMDMDDPTDVQVTDLMENYEGFVAFSIPKPEMGSDGWKYVVFTGYFDDVNKVKIFEGEGEDRHVKTSFSFKKTETGYVLEGKNMFFEKQEDGMGDMGDMAESPEMEEMVKGMMKVLLKGFEVRMDVQMPGTVTSAEGLPNKAGRVAGLVMTENEMSSPADMKKLSETQGFKIVCGESQVSAEELKTFKAELDAAKAEWADMKAKAVAEGHDEHEHDGEEEDGHK